LSKHAIDHQFHITTKSIVLGQRHKGVKPIVIEVVAGMSGHWTMYKKRMHIVYLTIMAMGLLGGM
jgi:hypothetical protein